jgi:hypothetical protein
VKLEAYTDADSNVLVTLPNGDVIKMPFATFGATYTAGYGLGLTGFEFYVDSSEVATLYDLSLKVNYIDTTAMLLPYLRKVDTASLSNRINTKLTVNGDSPAGTISAGTNNSNAFNIETNNTTRASFMANGNILINDAVSNGFDNIEIGGRVAVTNNTNNNLFRFHFPTGTHPVMQISEMGVATIYLSLGFVLGGQAAYVIGADEAPSLYANLAAGRLLFPKQGGNGINPVMQFNPSAPITPGLGTVGSLFVDSVSLWYVNRQARTGNIVDNTYATVNVSYTIEPGQTWLTYTGTGGNTWTLPTPRESREIKIKNKGSGTLTLSGSIYSNASVATYNLLVGEGIILISDGSDWSIVSKYVP